MGRKKEKLEVMEESADEARLEESSVVENVAGEESLPDNSSEDEPRIVPPEEKPAEATEAAEEDYLRKYQMKKQAVNGSKESDPPAGSKAEKMKKKLLKMPKIRFFIPRPEGEDKSILQTVNLNGYRLDFPKQAYLDIPQQIADVLMESLGQTEKALDQFRISGNKKKEYSLL